MSTYVKYHPVGSRLGEVTGRVAVGEVGRTYDLVIFVAFAICTDEETTLVRLRWVYNILCVL